MASAHKTSKIAAARSPAAAVPTTQAGSDTENDEEFDEFGAAQADATATLAAAGRARPATHEDDDPAPAAAAAVDADDGEESAAADIDSASENELEQNTGVLAELGFGMQRLYRDGSVARPLPMPGFNLCTFPRATRPLPSLRTQQDASPLADACYSFAGASRWSLSYMGTRVDRSMLARGPAAHKDHAVLGASLVIVWPALTPGTSITEREEAFGREYNGLAYHPPTRSYVLFRRADASPLKTDAQRTGATVTRKAPKPYYTWIPRPRFAGVSARAR